MYNNRILLFLIPLFLMSPLKAAEVLKVKNKKAIVQLKKEKVAIKDSMEVYDAFGNLTAVLKVYKVKNNKAYVNIVRGLAKEGFKVKIIRKKIAKKTPKKPVKKPPVKKPIETLPVAAESKVKEQKDKSNPTKKKTTTKSSKSTLFDSGYRGGGGAISDSFFAKPPFIFAADYYIPFKNKYITHIGASYWLGSDKDNEVAVASLEASIGMYNFFTKKHHIEYGAFFSASQVQTRYVVSGQIKTNLETIANTSPYINYNYHLNKSYGLGFELRYSALLGAAKSSNANIQLLFYFNLL